MFDAPWLKVEAGESYSEKFPNGVVERSKHVQFELRWHPRAAFYLSLHALHSRYHDFAHQAGADRTENSFLVKLWWEHSWRLGLD